jgi:hypothetical protein
MATNETTGGSSRLIDSIEDAEHASLESVRKFLDTVNDSFPDLGGGEDGPRRQIIDAAFKMTEHLVGASNRLAQNVLDMAEQRLNEAGKEKVS